MVDLVASARPPGVVGLAGAGALASGVGFGAAFQGAIRSVVPLTEAHERAGVLSLLYVVAYLDRAGYRHGVEARGGRMPVGM
jgi:hypothetical protein